MSDLLFKNSDFNSELELITSIVDKNVLEYGEVIFGSEDDRCLVLKNPFLKFVENPDYDTYGKLYYILERKVDSIINEVGEEEETHWDEWKKVSRNELIKFIYQLAIQTYDESQVPSLHVFEKQIP